MKNLKLRLIVMNFLQFAVWGAYLTCMGNYLGRAGMGANIAWFYALQGIVSIFMPTIMGIVADKWIQPQRLLGVDMEAGEVGHAERHSDGADWLEWMVGDVLAQAFGEPADAKKFAELAQWINYDGYRAMFESRGEYRRGLLLWMSHPAWPSMVWQTYDYYFEPIGAYFGCKKACEPLHIQLNLLTRNVEVVNYHAGDRTGLTAKVSVLDMGGKALDGYETPLDIPEDSTLVLAALPVPEDVTDVYYVKLELADAAGAPVSTNFYVQGKEEGNLQTLNQLGKASVKVSFTGKGPWKAVLTNTGDVPALMLRLKLVSKSTGEMVLPVIYSDNYFSLMPGEKREIDIEAAPEDLRGKAGLEVSGFNLDS